MSKKTLCFSLLALPSGYAANEVEKRMLVFLVAWPPVGGFFPRIVWRLGYSACGVQGLLVTPLMSFLWSSPKGM